MSSEPGPPSGPGRTLGEYVSALIEALASADPVALTRLRQVVGARRARIRLDDEAVEVVFVMGALVVEPAGGPLRVDGEGRTDRATVLDLMDGYLEVADAISAGRVDVVADVDAVARMFAAIEILIDASSRSPELQALAREFRREARGEAGRSPGRPDAPATAARPAEGAALREHEMLARLDLLPPGPGRLGASPDRL